MEAKDILILVGLSAMVVVVFMRDILGPFLNIVRDKMAGHDPHKSPNDNIGRLFSLINDFRVNVFDRLNGNENDHKKMRGDLSQLRQWHEPNQEGVQTWKGGDVVNEMKRNHGVMKEMLEEQKNQTAAIRDLVGGIRDQGLKINGITPQPQGGD